MDQNVEWNSTADCPPQLDEMKKKTGFFEQIPWGALLREVILSWLVAVLFEFLMLPSGGKNLTTMDSLEHMSHLRLFAIMAVVMFDLQLFGRKWDTERLERWGIFCSFGALCFLTVGANPTIPFKIAGLAAIALMLRFAFRRQVVRGLQCDERVWSVAGTAVMTLLFFLFLRNWGVFRVKTFATPSYDFGIFAQMFHNMRTIFMPVTTLERDGLLSHFQVHMSPIYYLMLPFYCLAPEPETLPALQAAVMASAVIPLWLLGKAHGLRPVSRMLLCGVLLVFPAYAGGISYDFHENCFLTPLLLWLFYGIERKNISVTAVSGTLTLMVKEDAAVYVAVIGLWVLIRALTASVDRKWELRLGAVLLGVSIAWFLGVTWYLSEHGDGVMTWRYRNLIVGESGSLLALIGTALVNPMKVLYECVDEEKLKYITYTMIPLLGIPLCSRKYDRLLMLIPYVLVNLMSDYSYQHDIFFQYSFGSTAFLMYLFLINLADWQQDWKRIAALAAALIVASMYFGKEVYPKAISYPEMYRDYQEYYESVEAVLEKVPDSVPTAATTYLTTSLSDREILYDIYYAEMDHILDCTYIVMKKSDTVSFRPYAVDGEKGYENFVTILEDNGYELWLDESGIAIYHRS